MEELENAKKKSKLEDQKLNRLIRAQRPKLSEQQTLLNKLMGQVKSLARPENQP
jgi:hypothetical protein